MKNTPYHDKASDRRIEYRPDMAAETAREQAIISIYKQIALYRAGLYSLHTQPRVLEQESTLNNAQKTSRQLWPALLVYWHIAMAREKSKQ